MEKKTETWGDIYKLFTDRNKDLIRYIADYRPANEDYKIQIWLKNGTTFYARWIYEFEEFALSEVEGEVEDEKM